MPLFCFSVQAWVQTKLPLFPGFGLNIALFQDAQSVLELNQNLQSGQLPLIPDLTVLLDADFIVDVCQVRVLECTGCPSLNPSVSLRFTQWTK